MSRAISELTGSHTGNPASFERTEYVIGKRYVERKFEQQTLRKALAQLSYFDGDGQLRLQTGGYNGSAFWFNKSVIMTNKHVVKNHGLADLEYIAFPGLVFYQRSQKDRVQDYINVRLERGKRDLAEGKKILAERIAQLKKVKTRSNRLEHILQSYLVDLESLEKYEARSFQDIVFIPIDQAIDKKFTEPADEPDIALIILKKPIDILLPELGIKNAVHDAWFAENSLYDPKRHGFIYAGTPIYLAGYGREINGSMTDKNKSLTVLMNGFLFNDNIVNYYGNYFTAWEKEREFYYFSHATAPGDSGARLEVLLDHNGKVSYSPLPLSQRKVTIGINTNDLHGSFFSKSTLLPFQSQLRIDPNLIPEDFIAVPSADAQYLCDFVPSTPANFRKDLGWHINYKVQKARRNYDVEETYLWTVILNHIFPAPGDQTPFNTFNTKARLAVAQYFDVEGSMSPSELNDDSWTKIILDSPEITANEKAIFKRLHEGTIFSDLGDELSVNLVNVLAKIPLRAYLHALDTWVQAKKYRRDKNYALRGFGPAGRETFATLDDLVKRF